LSIGYRGEDQTIKEKLLGFWGKRKRGKGWRGRSMVQTSPPSLLIKILCDH
jgi:hypothetical protein